MAIQHLSYRQQSLEEYTKLIMGLANYKRAFHRTIIVYFPRVLKMGSPKH